MGGMGYPPMGGMNPMMMQQMMGGGGFGAPYGGAGLGGAAGQA